MGTKRIGLARFEALMENLKRSLTMGTATMSIASLTATTGDIDLAAGTIEIANGGVVTQLSSKSTTVVLDKPTGKITMHAAALADAAAVTFQVTCASFARATDVCIVNHHSGGTVGAYSVDATGHATGNFKITVTNISGGSLGQALVLHYALIKTAHT